MKQLSYTVQTYDPPASGIGLILLQTDEVLENEFRRFLPSAASVFHTRVPSGDEVTAETLARMEAEIPAATRLLPPAADIGVIAYCCTSGTTVIGEEKVTAAVHSIRPGVAVTNPLTAVKAKLRSLGTNRISLLTPYEPEVSRTMAVHLEDEGFEISSFGAFGEKEEAKVTRISQTSILEAIEAIGSGVQCDCVFASCTNLRTVDLLKEASSRIGKPVISSNSALAWHIGVLLKEQHA
jgi:maleate isomerase